MAGSSAATPQPNPDPAPPTPRVTAVIPVYGDAPYLGALLDSLENQNEPVAIVASGSTIGANAQAVLAEHGVGVARHGGGSIGADWNFARQQATSEYFFFAHQDDRYRPDYAAELASLLAADPDATMAWCDYDVIGDGVDRAATRLPILKRVMTETFTAGRTELRTSRARKWINAFGPIMGCPTVMFRTAALDDFDWDTTMRLNVDWDAWYRLSQTAGSFVRSRRKLVEIRLHQQAESTAGKASGARTNEDLALLGRYWPRPAAKIIQRVMGTAY